MALLKTWTLTGAKALGRASQRSRKVAGLSQLELCDRVKRLHDGRHRMNQSKFSELERGKYIPSHNDAVTLAALEYIVHPQTGDPWDFEALNDILAEHLDPDTGWYRLPAFCQRTLSNAIAVELRNRDPLDEWRAFEALAAATGLDVPALDALLDGRPPGDRELEALARGLRRSPTEYWSAAALRELAAANARVCVA